MNTSRSETAKIIQLHIENNEKLLQALEGFLFIFAEAKTQREVFSTLEDIYGLGLSRELMKDWIKLVDEVVLPDILKGR